MSGDLTKEEIKGARKMAKALYERTIFQYKDAFKKPDESALSQKAKDLISAIKKAEFDRSHQPAIYELFSLAIEEDITPFAGSGSMENRFKVATVLVATADTTGHGCEVNKPVLIRHECGAHVRMDGRQTGGHFQKDPSGLRLPTMDEVFQVVSANYKQLMKKLPIAAMMKDAVITATLEFGT